MIRIDKILVIALTVICASCNEYLDFNYESQVGEDKFNSNDEELYTSLVGCYNGLQDAIHREWAVTDLRSDISRVHNNNTSSSPYNHITGLDCSSIQSNNLFIEEYWGATYRNIKNCNIVIRDIDVVKDDAKRNEYYAEATFMRAYHYFNLVRLFGGVPLALTKLTIEQANTMPRNSIDEVYDQIESDLEAIVDGGWLPDTRSESELGRVTGYAAKVLLAKVYMTRYEVMSDEWLQAEALLNDVVSALGAPTVPYADIFSTTNEMNDEILFAVRFKAGNIGIGSPFGNEFAPTSSGIFVLAGGGNGFNQPTEDFLASYEAGDLRKEATMSEGYLNTNLNEVVDFSYVTKYLTPQQAEGDSESDWPVLRHADAVLLYAEILAEKGELSSSAAQVNAVRARAGLGDLPTEASANIFALRDAIRHERMIELAFENHRWFDLLRWGIALDVVNPHYATELDDDNVSPYYQNLVTGMIETEQVLPIPFVVINANTSGNMVQNAGY